MRTFVMSLCVAVALMVVAAPAQAADHPQKAGKWKVTYQMEMPGMPVKLPPMSMEICLTEEDLADPQKAVPSDPKSDCKVSDYEIDGKTVTWSMECPKQNMKGTGEITYSDTTYSGSMKMTMSEQEMSMKYSGKWLGECKK